MKQPTRRWNARSAITSAALLGVSVVFSACRGETGENSRADGNGATTSTAGSTKGVRTVENGVETFTFDGLTLQSAPLWTIDTTPLMVAGGADAPPEFDLTYASNAALLSDGALATYVIIGSRLLLFSADGKAERVIGRQGKGPGEFMRARMVHGAADTLIVLDAANNRLNKVLRDGTFPMTKALAKPVPGAAHLAAALPGGLLILSEAGTYPKSNSLLDSDAKGAQRDTSLSPPAPIYVFRADSGMREIALVPDLEMRNVEMRNNGRVRLEEMPLRFTSMARLVVWDTLLVTSAGPSREFVVRNSNGRILSHFKVNSPRRAVTQSMRDQQIAIELERLNSTRGEGGSDIVDLNERRRLAREAPFADSLPGVQYLFTTPDRTLWVVDGFAGVGSMLTATAFTRDGSVARRLEIPRSGAPMAFGTDRVVLRVADDDGVVSIRVHKLIPAPRP